MDPDHAPAADEQVEETGRFPSGLPATFANILRRSDLVVAAVPADPPWRELGIKCIEHVKDGQTRRLGPPLKTNAGRWQVTAVVAVRVDGSAPPEVGSVIEVLTAQIGLLIHDHAAYHRPGMGMTISRPCLQPYSHGLPHDHAGEALLPLSRCQGWLAEHAPYQEVIDGGLLPVARRGEIEACWPELHPAPPPPRPAQRWWWPW